MVGSGDLDSETVAVTSRRLLAEANANYLVKSQEMARVSRLTVYENVDTGEVTYIDPDTNAVYEPTVATATETVAAGSGPIGVAGDPDAGARHVKIAISFVLVVVLTWAWFLQRKAALQAARQSGG